MLTEGKWRGGRPDTGRSDLSTAASLIAADNSWPRRAMLFCSRPEIRMRDPVIFVEEAPRKAHP